MNVYSPRPPPPPSKGGGTSIFLLIGILILFLAVIGLVIWIVILLRKQKTPNCLSQCPPTDATCGAFCKGNCSNYCALQSSIPIYLYGFNGTDNLCSTTSQGVLVQADGQGNPSSSGTVIQVLSAVTSNTLAQWYIIPGSISGTVYLQNVSTSQYLSSGALSGSDIAITLTPTIGSATAFNMNYAPNEGNSLAFTFSSGGITYFLNVNGDSPTFAQFYADSISSTRSNNFWVTVPVPATIGTSSSTCS